jgi:hypothetical protein
MTAAGAPRLPTLQLKGWTAAETTNAGIRDQIRLNIVPPASTSSPATLPSPPATPKLQKLLPRTDPLYELLEKTIRFVI